MHVYMSVTTIVEKALCIHFVGVEKNNDTAKHCYYSSNKHDPCGEVIRTEKRQEALEQCRREKRPYSKRDEEYWSTGIRQKRAKPPHDAD